MNSESRHVFNLLFYLRITESSVGIPLLMKKTSDNDLSHVLLREKLSLPPLLPLRKRYSLELVSLKALESREKKKGWTVTPRDRHGIGNLATHLCALYCVLLRQILILCNLDLTSLTKNQNYRLCILACLYPPCTPTPSSHISSSSK